MSVQTSNAASAPHYPERCCEGCGVGPNASPSVLLRDSGYVKCEVCAAADLEYVAAVDELHYLVRVWLQRRSGEASAVFLRSVLSHFAGDLDSATIERMIGKAAANAMS